MLLRLVSALRLLVLATLAGAMFAAPLLCLRFCELQDTISMRTPQVWACMHAPRAAQQECNEPTGMRLLERIQRLLSSVTEFVVAALVLLVSMQATRLHNLPMPQCTTTFLRLPDPPPRQRAHPLRCA